MLTLPTNWTNVIGRLLFLVVTFFLAYLVAGFELKEQIDAKTIFHINAINFDFKSTHLLYLLVALIGYLILTIAISLLSINKIQVDTAINTITFVRLFNKRTIAINDINEYYQTFHRNPFKIWYGLSIKFGSNQTIDVAGQNVKSLSDLKDYLDTNKVNYAGQIRMKFPFA